MKKLLLTDNELMKDYNYKKNKNIDINRITFGSNKKVWWKCHICGYEWQTTVVNRAGSLKRGCPKCSRIKASMNHSLTRAYHNNISKLYPNIAAEWHPTKNGNLTPDKISYGSEKKVWWKCSWCKQEWECAVNKRTTRGCGCPNCSKSSTSFPEQAIFYYIKKYFSDSKNRDLSNGFELDIFIPSKKVGIEYDGVRWHNNANTLLKDNKKDENCKINGIELFRLRDKKLKKTISAKIIRINDGNICDLQLAIQEILAYLSIKEVKIDILADMSKILGLYRRNLKKDSLLFKYPDIAAEWHPTKNGELKPENIYWSSGKKVWWKCHICGYEWQATPNHRTRERMGGYSGCPKCAIKRINDKNKVKVINLDTGVIYDSLTEAANSCNGNKSTLCGCLNNKNKTAYGYHWTYVDNNERRRKSIKSKILNIDKNIIFNDSKEAAKWCNGDSRMINRCCNGITRTAYGYQWQYYDNKKS
jgi:hypothetical protein